MRKRNKNEQPDESLHRNAEERLRQKKLDTESSMSVVDLTSLTFELQVHQIELEMQNEELQQTKHEAEQLKEQYIDLYNFAPVGYFIFDKIGTILSVNLTGSNLLEIDKNSLINRRFQLYLDPDFRTIFTNNIKEIIGNNEKHIFEVKLLRDNDLPVYLLIEGIRDENDGKDGVCRAAVTDITERIKAEKVLNTSKEQYQLLFDSINEGFYIADIIYDDAGLPVDYRFIEVNPAFEQMMNISRAQMVGKSARELFPDLSSHWLQTFHDVAATGTPVITEFYSETFRKYYGVYASRPSKNKFAAVVKDITARRLAEEELESSESRYRQLFETMTEGFALHEIICDSNDVPIDYRFLDINPAFEQLTGLKYEDVIGNTYRNLLPDDNPAWLQAFGEVALTGHPVHFNDFSPVLNRHYEVFAYSPVPRQFAVIFTDITERKQAEQALKKYRILSDYSRDIMLFVRLDGQIIEANNAAVSAYGYTHDELINLTIYNLRSFDSPIQTAEQMAEANITGLLYETIHCRKDGSCFSVEVSSRGADIDGQQVILHIVRDITQRKQALDALEESEKNYRELIQNANSAIIRWSSDGKIVFFNEYAQHLFGYTENEIIGQDVSILLPEIDSTGADLTVLVTKVTTNPEIYSTNVNENILRDGTRIWMNWTNKPVFDKDGNLVEILAVGSDISEYKQAEESLRQSEKRLNRSQQIAHLGSWELDLQTNHLIWSDEVYNIFGLQPQEFEATYEAFLDAVHPDDREAVNSAYLTSIQDELDYYEIEHRIIKKPHGEVRVVHERCEHLRNQSRQIIRSSGMVHDITERKQVEGALRDSNTRLAILSEAANQILTAEDPQKVVQSICHLIMEHLDCHVFFNYLIDEKKACLHLNACEGIPEDLKKQIEWLDYGTAVCGCAARDKCRIVTENIFETPDPRTKFVKSFGIQAYACHPLIGHDGSVIGTLSFGTRSRTSFNEDDITLMKTITDQVATAIERVKLHAESDRRAAEMESFVSSLADGVSKIDLKGSIQWMNATGREILHIQPEESLSDWLSGYESLTLEGKPLPPEEEVGFRALNGEHVSDFRYKVVTPCGDIIILSISASPVYDNQGRIIGATSTFRDQSERVGFEIEKQRILDRELHISEVLQHAILPPSVPSHLMGYEIAVKYLPALNEAEIGGDFYDVFDLGDNRFAVLIGDVVGKGLKAAMRVAAARHAIRSYAYLDPRPSRVLTLANNALCKDTSDESQLLTLFYAVIDPGIGGLSYSSAGHVPPVICSKNGTCDELESDGIPLGVFPGFEYEQTSHRLEPGDLLVMVTDGITEARADKSNYFGQEKLLEHVRRNRQKSPDEIASSIVEVAINYAGGYLHDDAAVVVFTAAIGKM